MYHSELVAKLKSKTYFISVWLHKEMYFSYLYLVDKVLGDH